MRNGAGKEEVQLKMIAKLGTKADKVAEKSAAGAEADEAAGKQIRVLYRAGRTTRSPRNQQQEQRPFVYYIVPDGRRCGRGGY